MLTTIREGARDTMRLTKSEVPPDCSANLVDTSLGAHFAAAAAQHPEREFLIFASDDGVTQRLTYGDMVERATVAAHALLSEFDVGERVAIWAPNNVEWVTFQLGAALAGLTIVTVNPALVAAEVQHILSQSRAAGIVHADEWRGNQMTEIVAELSPALSDLRTVIPLGEWDDFVSREHPVADLPMVDAGSPMMIQYTSGTTGQPKGVVLSHHGCVNNARMMVHRFELPEASRWLGVLPLFHVGGSVINIIGTMSVGGTLVLQDKFDADEAVRALEEESINYVAAVPTMLLAMIEVQREAPRDISSLCAVMGGGATVPPEMVRAIESGLGVPFGTMYGSTETSAMVTNSRLDDSVEDKSSNAGPPIPQVEVRITNPDTGAVVDVGSVGSIEVRSFGVMMEYFDMPAETAAAIDEDGWFTTGDLGSVDDRGYLTIRGRLKEMIIRGGENIYPAEIEKVLHDHEAIGMVAVVGVPDERLGEEIAAFVQLRPGHACTANDLEAFARSRLARFKVPRKWHLVDEFPLTPSGKVQKHRLDESIGRALLPEGD